jgi:NAD(P)-dependent dehydrogenase (short-subunit alcohol dehydrogenase family)
MKKQTIIITGASAGIGIAIARQFLINGDYVVLNITTMEKSTEVFRELGAHENLAMVAGNAIDRITGIKLLATAVARFGSADVLVNSVGDFSTKRFFDVDVDYFDTFIDNNLKGTFFITQGIIPQMLKQGSGTVINIDAHLISHSWRTDKDSKLLLPKGINHSLTMQLAAEFGNRNIRFHTITPDKNGDWTTAENFPNRLNKFESIAQIAYSIAKGNFNGAS